MLNEYLNWEDLIKYPNCDKIIWQENIGKSLCFVYNGLPHSLIIKNISRSDRGHSTNVTVMFDNGIEKTIRSERLKDMPFAKIYPHYSNKYSAGDLVNGLTILEVINQKRENYNWNVKKYMVKCEVDGYIYEILESDLIRGSRCPVCYNKKVVPGINDLATTDPWMVEYFDDKTFAEKYTSKSGAEIVAKCPTCHCTRKVSIEVLHRYGFRCDYCGDQISYPNKFMTSVLRQLENMGVIRQYKREYTSDWSRNYKYDNYFIFDNKEYIVEMDGGFHYQDNAFSHEDVKHAKKRDKEKDELATVHGIHILRIDCNYNNIAFRFEYIRTNVLNILSPIIDLSNIDWEKVGIFAESNLLKEVCECYANGMSRKEICERYDYISNSTIGNYLHIGTLYGLCLYEPSYSKKYQYYILVMNGQEIERTSSYKKMSSILKDKYGISISKCQFYRRIKSNLPILDSYYIQGIPL